MPLLHRLVLALCVCVVAAPERAADAQLTPTVRLVATGGTIANHPAGRLTARELVALVSPLDLRVTVEVEQFANVPSTAIGLDQWLRLARRINRLFDQRPDLGGIVVTSGTDTLEETAYFLHLTVKSDRPVVVVGAMRSPDADGYDGATNLLHAFQVAAAPASRGRGVMVVLNNEIHGARAVTKRHAHRLDAFDSSPYGPLGVIDPDRIVYYRRPTRRHTRRAEFDLSRVTRLPRVDIIMSYLGASGDLIMATRQHGAAGLVIAATGAGSATPGQNDAIRAMLDEGVVVVITTRTGGGRIPRRRRLGRTTAGGVDWRNAPNYISGEDLSPVKARILLMLALTLTSDGSTIQRMFTVY